MGEAPAASHAMPLAARASALAASQPGSDRDRWFNGTSRCGLFQAEAGRRESAEVMQSLLSQCAEDMDAREPGSCRS